MKCSIYCCYTPVEPHQLLHYPIIFYTFFSLFKILLSPILIKKKKKKIFFSPLIHTTFSLPFFPFISPLLSTLWLHFLPHSYILTIFLSISFCINLISFSLFSPYFFPHKTMSTLSLSLSLSLSLWIFVLSYTSN